MGERDRGKEGRRDGGGETEGGRVGRGTEENFQRIKPT